MKRTVIGLILFALFSLMTAALPTLADDKSTSITWYAGYAQYQEDLQTVGFTPVPHDVGESYGITVECFDSADNAYYEFTQQNGVWQVHTLIGWVPVWPYVEKQTNLTRGVEVFTGTKTELYTWMKTLFCPEDRLIVEDGVIMLRADQVIAIRQEAQHLRVQLPGYASAPVSWSQDDGWVVGGALPGYSAQSKDGEMLFIGLSEARDVFEDSSLDTINQLMNIGFIRLYKNAPGEEEHFSPQAVIVIYNFQ